jgi:hypothetical protein
MFVSELNPLSGAPLHRLSSGLTLDLSGKTCQSSISFSHRVRDEKKCLGYKTDGGVELCRSKQCRATINVACQVVAMLR